MDDLSGLDWSSTSGTTTPKVPPVNPPSAFSYASLRPSPSPLNSGRNTPLSAQGSGNVAPKPATAKPAQDSFSNLMNFGPAKGTANLSLREQQERLEAEKRKKEEERRKQAQAHYGDGQFFDVLAQRSAGNSRTASPAIPPPTLSAADARNGKPTDSDDDLFAAFKADTKVDNSSHFPPPAQNGSRKSTPANAPQLDLRNPTAWSKPAPTVDTEELGDDDDPFGLNQLREKSPVPASATTADEGEDDDLLGDLARPVEEVRRKVEAQRPAPAPASEPGKPIEDSDSDSAEDGDGGADNQAAQTSNDPFDKAVAQLVDYGFTPENARRGLTESGAGLNVQAAVNWLLDDAHRQAKEKARAKQSPVDPAGTAEDRQAGRARNAGPAWMRDEDAPHRRDNHSPGLVDGDLAKTAAAMGTTFLKTANSLWKTGQKRVQKAVQDFQQESDPSQPKWMRSAQQERAAHEGKQGRADATDEAAMLEAGMRPERRQTRPMPPDPRLRTESNASSRNPSPAVAGARNGSVPRWQQQQPQQPQHSQPSIPDPRSRLHKQLLEEQTAQAYVSPARRRKGTPQPAAETGPTSKPDAELLPFSDSSASRPQAPAAQRRTPQPQAAPKPAPPPRKAPTPRPVRQIPSVAPGALQASAKHRAEGAAHFKRGDYAAAHSSYSSSLSSIPSSHPIAVVILCNRALTALKTGEPRQAVEDADAALAVIGPGKGEGESVALEDGTSEKRDMKDLYGKALTRKAEALEQMEKWAEAGTVWQSCVEAGVGGHAAIAGRQRCQKALAPKPAAKPATPSPRPTSTAAAAAARPKPRPAASQGQSFEAVERLRAANQAAEKADDEKFALSDKIDARISAWRDGKRDNLRALLCSLDQVLWENSGWKPVGLHEVVMANKVKIVYMKAIAKTHPDKLPQDANTEVRMIAGTVFSTLNESWDKFKAENGL